MRLDPGMEFDAKRIVEVAGQVLVRRALWGAAEITFRVMLRNEPAKRAVARDGGLALLAVRNMGGDHRAGAQSSAVQPADRGSRHGPERTSQRESY